MFQRATSQRLVRCCGGGWLLLAASIVWSQTQSDQDADKAAAPRARMDILAPQEWDAVREAIDRGLVFLASQQQPDGSFPAYPTGNPAITSFCVMAFLAQGHSPGEGRYGRAMDRAIDYALACQRKDGLIAKIPPLGDDIDPSRNPSHTAIYNHAITGVMLCEVYGMVDAERSQKIGAAIERALRFTLDQQLWPKRLQEDVGGWRYVRRHTPEIADSDLSHTSWQLTFLRAAKNAGFDVPSERIKLAIHYIQTRFSPTDGTFHYAARQRQEGLVATAGAGILSLSMSGLHNSSMAQSAADWLLQQPFDPYPNRQIERYHYAAFLSSMAMFQMGGRYWEQFFPVLAKELVGGQRSNGSWKYGLLQRDNEARWGTAYTTSMAILALAAPNQLIPVYQR